MFEQVVTEAVRRSRYVIVYHVGLETPPEVEGVRATVDLDGALSRAPSPEFEVVEVLVLAGTPTDLRRAASLQASLSMARAVVVMVAEAPHWYPAPAPSLTPAHRWRTLTELRVHKPAGAAWAVEARFSAHAPAGRVLAATARAFAGNRLDTVDSSPVAALAGPGAAAWRPGDPNASVTPPAGPLPLRIGAPGGDVVVRTVADPPEWDGPRPPVDLTPPEELSWERIGRPGGGALLARDLSDPRLVPPVDDRSVNPINFVTTPRRGVGDLVTEGDRWAVTHEGEVMTRIAPSGCVTVVDVSRIRQLRGLRIDWRRGHSGPLAAVRAVASLAAAGVPLIGGELPKWAGALGPELAGLLGSVTEDDLADDLRREEYSIRLRRRALRDHGVRARWEQMGAPAGRRPLTSVLLPTRRPDMLGFALGQISRQRDADLEVILALHGIPREHPSVASALAGFDRPITVLEIGAGTVFGEVLNQAAARASGSFLLKMDDDDWYGPDFLADLLLAQSYSGADVVGTAPEFVYLASIDVTVHREQITEQITNFIAGGTILATRSAFEAVGGFRPIPSTVDTQFQHAIQIAGGQIYRAHGLGYILRRGPAASHTWREPIGTFLKRNRRQWRGFRPNALMELPEGAAVAEGVR
ncbi:glycosyltransferase [Microbispora sp. RL4-1S]|uniref:Glycosyltransferase n=1 Tax=Microbispora oryzae TaxID=2806554 RepID=A0A940WJQ7_9ACTN|nr:glycosyltransferase family A protein [Microbispora oryzae]MBP2705182.1 glycosyltransferase [Microbispora oryzae]